MKVLFNWKFYLEYYPHLKNKGINTKKKAMQHYKNYGSKRHFITHINDFDWKFYIDTYPEVKKSIKTKAQAYRHYTQIGKKQGKKRNRLSLNTSNNIGAEAAARETVDDNMKEYISINNIDTFISSNYKRKEFLNKKTTFENSIEIDDQLYKYLWGNKNNIYKHIHDVGIENGHIYTIKQIKNHFNIDKIYSKNNKLYYKVKNDYVELIPLISSLYKKDFSYFINDIELIEKTTQTITDDIICCFLDNEDIGKNLLKKILASSKKNLSVVLIFRGKKMYENFKDLIELFKNRVVFISKEYGTDIIPTLQAINHMFDNYDNIKNIYKFHTKTNRKWFNECTDYLLNNEMNYNDSCNCVGHPNYYRNINKDVFCKTLIDKNKNKIDKEQFVMGTMFYTKMEVFTEILTFMKTNYFQYFMNNCYDNNIVLFDNSPPHFLERLFGLIKVSNKMNYGIVKENKNEAFVNNKLWAHLHCYDIDKFDEIYGEYIKDIMKYFSVIITYSKGINIPNFNFNIIKVKLFDAYTCINIFKEKNYDNLIISNGTHIIFLNRSINFTTNIFDLFSAFNKNNNDILSPMVKFNNKLFYYGGIINKYFKNYINNDIIDITSYINKSIFYCKETDMFFEDIYVCRIKNFLEIFKSDSNINFKKYIIYVTPFIVVDLLELKPMYKYSLQTNLIHTNIDLYKFNSKYYLKDANIINKRKNILIIEHSILMPDQDCGSKYIYNFIKTLLKLNYHIYFFQCNFNDNKNAIKYIQDLQSMGVYVSLPNNNWDYNKIELLLKENFNLFDYIFVSRYDKMIKFYNLIKKYNPRAKLCFQTHDLNFLRTERENELIKSKNTMSDINKIKIDKKNEINLIKNCSVSIIVSKFEYDLLIRDYNIDKNKLFNYPIFFDSIEKKYTYNNSNNIIFIGSLHKPNIDSMKYFLKNYFKDIVQRIPNIVLNIVGRCCNELKIYKTEYENNLNLLYYLSDKNLEIVLSNTRLSIIPLIYGAGVKGKVLDSFNNGIPVITSAIGAEGIICKNEEDIIILDYEDNYVNKFVNYYNNKELLKKISINSKLTFENNYSTRNSISYCKKLFNQIDNNKIYCNVKKTNKICILYQIYNDTNIEEIYSYFNNLCNEYYYDMIVINNNDKLNLKSNNKDIKILEGDNSNHEFSAYQVGIDYLLNNNLFKRYNNIIICNETFYKNTPTTFINKINYDIFKNIIDNNNICGIVDSFNKYFTLDDFKFKIWIRSNLIIFPIELINTIKTVNVYTKYNTYENNKLKIHVNSDLIDRLEKILSSEYYKNIDKSSKITRIFNEYKLTHNLLKNYNKEIINLYEI